MKNLNFLNVFSLSFFALLFVFSNYNCGDNGVSSGIFSGGNLDGKTINVSGVVTYESGKPVDSALVTLYYLSLATNPPKVSTRTNSKGQYSLSKFFNGKNIKLNVSKLVTDSLGVLRSYNSLINGVQWIDEPQVLNVRIKLVATYN